MSALSIQGRLSNETLLFNRSECSTIRFYSLNAYQTPRILSLPLRLRDKIGLGQEYERREKAIRIKRHDFGRLFRPVKFSVLDSFPSI